METKSRAIDWNAVRLLCRMEGLSLAQVALRAGYARQYLYQMRKTGKNGPVAAERLARVFGVNESVLLKEDLGDGQDD